MQMTVVLGACALLLAGCTAGQKTAAAVPYPAVPPPQSEAIPKPPVSDQPLIWQPGHWDWTGSAYAWTGGAWVLRAGHGTGWQDGYWKQVDGKWTWVGPHWI
jgi:hypothetical protein